MGFLNDLAVRSYRIAQEHGFHTPEQENVPLKLVLIHSEISEALEEWRRGALDRVGHDNKPEGFGAELADAIIRIADLAAMIGVDLDKAVAEKQAFNETRAYMHGGKLF